MKLVVVARAFWSDVGEADAARELTTELVKLGVELIAVIHADSHVKSPYQPFPQKTLMPLSMGHGLLSKPPLDWYYLSARAAKTLMLLRRDLGTDCIIHCHNLVPTAFSTCKCVETDTKFFTTLHGTFNGEVERFSREIPVHPRELLYRLGYVSSHYLYNFLLKQSKGQIIALSPKNAYDVVRLGLERSRVHIIPNGVDLSFFKPHNKTEARKRLGLPLDRLIVLTIDEIQPRKGLHMLIKAARAITGSVREAHFVIVGRVPSDGLWYMAYLRKLLRTLDLCKHFDFTGFVPKDELPLYLSAADLFALPSYCEGAPLVVPGAMACGCVVVATESAAAGYLPTNLIVKNGDYDGLAERISYYLSNEKQRKQSAEGLREKAVTELSWRRIAKRTLALYRNVMTDDSV
jgi:glycosyltransferase involved in cell wall biosynthesis